MDKNQKMPLVSVVMSVYNTEKYVGEAIESVLAQSYNYLELICFNDASTDSSLGVLEAYAARDSRVRIINSTVNIKQGGGRNRAIKAARGEYIMFLDSDDMLAPRAMQKCVEAALEHDSEAVFFDYCRYYASTGKEELLCPLGPDAAALTGDDLRRRILLRATSHVTAMYARRVIVDNDLFFPEGVFYEDNAVTQPMQLAARNPVKLDAMLYRYRSDNQSVTRSANNPRFFDRIATAEMFLAHMKRLGLYDRFKDLVDYQFFNLYFVHTVFGAIYRFDKARTAEIRLVREGLKRYLPDYRRNPYYRAMPLRFKLKLASHVRFPRIIKLLSDTNRLLHRRR